MSQIWHDRRSQQAARLEARARQTGSQADYLVWEQYARKTVQMETVAGALERHLDGRHYRVAHGLSVRHRGRTLYLEHVVTGPAGLYLIETLDQASFTWQQDLERNLAFCREVLGAAAHHFACLVIQKEPLRGTLPPGAHLVDSAEVALQVLTGTGVLVPPSVADEFWRTLYALDAGEAEQPATPSFWRKLGWLGAATMVPPLVVAALLVNDVFLGSAAEMAVGIPIALVMLAGPVAVVVLLLQLIPHNGLRRGLMWTLLVIEILIMLLAFIGWTQE